MATTLKPILAISEKQTKHAGLFAGYDPIDRRNWRATPRFARFCAAIELRAWWTEFGDHQRAASMVADLERYG